MPTALNIKFFEKSQAAMLAAIEVYNKPKFTYREETFCLLAINAWELMLKAKVLRENGNQIRAIQVFEPRKLKGGTFSRVHKTLKKNRSGNALTIGIPSCINALRMRGFSLSPAVSTNIDALTEVRDNAVHFIVASEILQRGVLEIACATIKNYVLLSKQWFDRDLTTEFTLTMPLAFFDGANPVDGIVITRDESRLIERLKSLASVPVLPNDQFNVAVRLDVRMHRSNLPNAARVQVTRDADALALRLDHDAMMEQYPWSNNEVHNRIKQRFPAIKFNKAFYAIKKPLMENKALVHVRLLDPNNPRGQRKPFFSPNFLQQFAAAYLAAEHL